MPTRLRQGTAEFYEGIAVAVAIRIRIAGERARGAAVSTALGASGATTSVEAADGAAGVAETSGTSMDSGLIATESGGLRTTGGPLGKRSGWAA